MFNMTFSQGLTKPMNSQLVFLIWSKKEDQNGNNDRKPDSEKWTFLTELFCGGCACSAIYLKFDILKFLFPSYYDKKGVCIYMFISREISR